MTRVTQTSAATDPSSLFTPPTSTAAHTMSTPTPTAGPVPTSLPPGVAKDASPEPTAQDDEVDEESKSFELPKLRLIIEDLSHPGAKRFLAASDASTVLAKSVKTVLRQLYRSPSSKILPGTRSVTLYLESMDGVAYTVGSSLDNDHKEIHFSVDYINGIRKAPEGSDGDVTGAYEIVGVLVHELVHCFQYNGLGTCPGGLIEGVADFVRLRAHLSPPHWKRHNLPKRWDAGYEKTGFFLDWLASRYGEDAARRINEKLRDEKYEENEFWAGLFGKGIEDLWTEYESAVKNEWWRCV